MSDLTSFRRATRFDFNEMDIVPPKRSIIRQEWGEWTLAVFFTDDYLGPYKGIISNGEYTAEYEGEDPDRNDAPTGDLWAEAWEVFDDAMVNAEELHTPSEYF